MKKLILLLSTIICLYHDINAQLKAFDCMRPNAVIDGKLFKNKHFFKFFAVMLQDTCTSFNRFTNYFYIGTDSKNNLPEKYYNAVVIDTSQAIKAEKAIKKLNTKLYRYIRLYAGFVDDQNDTCVVVQFLKGKEYRKEKNFSKQMILIARPKRDLFFIVLKIEGNEAIIKKYFPNDFFIK